MIVKREKPWTITEALHHYAEQLKYGSAVFDLVQQLSPQQRAMFDEFMAALDVVGPPPPKKRKQ